MHIHFVAIGGAIMHQLAIALKNQGHIVTGSDDAIFDPSKSNLQKAGLLPDELGFNANNIHNGIDEVILGMHAKADNPELLVAQQLGISIVSFPEYIYRCSANKTRIVIAGSHGKTSTTAAVMHALQALNIDFDYLVGAKLDGFEYSVKLTDDAPYMIIEGDEYLSSPIDRTSKFHFYQPHITMITGIAWDHINVFPTFQNYLDTFKKYIQELNAESKLIYFERDSHLQQLVNENASCEAIPYNTPQYRIEQETTSVLINQAEYHLSVFGEHNLQNLEGARKMLAHIGIQADAFYNALQNFTGAARRLEQVYSNDQLTVFRDFAHAPSKVHATVKAVKEQYGAHPVITIFELHTFSSFNKTFIQQYKNCMDGIQYPIVFFSQNTLKHKNIQNFTRQHVANAFHLPVDVVFDDISALKKHLKAIQADVNQSTWLWMSSGTFEDENVVELSKSA